MMETPVQDEHSVLGGFSPISNWGDFDSTTNISSGILKSGEDKVLEKLESMEVLVRELHLSTREHVAKGLRELLSYERALINKVLKNMEDINTRIREVQSRHQADPALVASIVALVNQSIKYLQDTAPSVVTNGQEDSTGTQREGN